MIDRKQTEHFKAKKNRYDEQLLFAPPKHTQEETNSIIRELKSRNINSVVEFGSGNGRLTLPLLQSGIRVTAVDISKESLETLSNSASKMNIKKGLLFTSLTIPNSRWEAIVGCDILHHVELNTYLREMNQKLIKSKGVIIFSEPNILNLSWSLFITFFIDWRVEWRILYCNYFTLRKKLERYHFKNIRISGFGLFPLPLFNTMPFLQDINYFLGNVPVLKLFAYRLIIVAEAN